MLGGGSFWTLDTSRSCSLRRLVPVDGLLLLIEVQNSAGVFLLAGVIRLENSAMMSADRLQLLWKTVGDAQHHHRDVKVPTPYAQVGQLLPS